MTFIDSTRRVLVRMRRLPRHLKVTEVRDASGIRQWRWLCSACPFAGTESSRDQARTRAREHAASGTCVKSPPKVRAN
ncbi:hypothetical protein [Nocardiopsis ansamitocini]|nr:hypothetical protein [Nocardiopsis ansamitocini]